jgi:hypothetical protein
MIQAFTKRQHFLPYVKGEFLDLFAQIDQLGRNLIFAPLLHVRFRHRITQLDIPEGTGIILCSMRNRNLCASRAECRFSPGFPQNSLDFSAASFRCSLPDVKNRQHDCSFLLTGVLLEARLGPLTHSGERDFV